MNEPGQRTVLVGFTEDVAKVAKQLEATSAALIQITEAATDADLPDRADTAVYVLSRDVAYSSRLHSVCVYVHDRLGMVHEYLLPVEKIDLTNRVFPELAGLPVITVSDLKNKLGS